MVVNHQKDYLEENMDRVGERRHLFYGSILSLAVAVALCIILLLSGMFVSAEGEFSSIRDVFRISNIEEREFFWDRYYTADITNGYCSVIVKMSEYEAEQVNEGDFVYVNIITSKESTRSVASLNLELSEEYYGVYYNTHRDYAFLYGTAYDIASGNVI